MAKCGWWSSGQRLINFCRFPKLLLLHHPPHWVPFGGISRKCSPPFKQRSKWGLVINNNPISLSLFQSSEFCTFTWWSCNQSETLWRTLLGLSSTELTLNGRAFPWGLNMDGGVDGWVGKMHEIMMNGYNLSYPCTLWLKVITLSIFRTISALDGRGTYYHSILFQLKPKPFQPGFGWRMLWGWSSATYSNSIKGLRAAAAAVAVSSATLICLCIYPSLPLLISPRVTAHSFAMAWHGIVILIVVGVTGDNRDSQCSAMVDGMKQLQWMIGKREEKKRLRDDATV